MDATNPNNWLFWLQLLNSREPVNGLVALQAQGLLPPELLALVGCKQNPQHHPEGDAWQHTLLVVSEARRCLHNVPIQWQTAFMFGALLHDVGKPLVVNPETLDMHGHAAAGEAPARAFLQRIGAGEDITAKIIAIVINHMGVSGNRQAKEKAWLKLHERLPLNVGAPLAACDKSSSTGIHVDDPNFKYEPSEIAMRYLAVFEGGSK
jgi:tRNA nucleotidyltransferase (CCA-adding enzyme)